MTKYFFIAFGDFSEKSKKQFVLDSFLEITNSWTLKFRVLPNAIVIHFGTKSELDKVKVKVETTMQNFSKVYFLVENTDKKVLSMFGNELEEFLYLDGQKPKNVIIKDKEEKKTQETKKSDFFDDILESFAKIKKDDGEIENDGYDKLLKNCTKNKEKVYNLDEILDKINEKGINSLTPEEHKYLNNLSN
jgi:hypothetical protein